MTGTLAARLAASGFALLWISGPQVAHHGTSRSGLEKTVTLSGMVTGFETLTAWFTWT